MENLVIRRVIPTDDLETLAKILYGTDPYIYPAAFGEDADRAKAAMAALMRLPGNLFHYANLYGAFLKEVPCGVLLLNSGSIQWDTGTCMDLVGDLLCDKNAFSYVASNYFSEVSQEPEEGTAEIVALCVASECRGTGIGKRLLQYAMETEPASCFTLDVLAENPGAIALYLKCGFQIVRQVCGFSMKTDKPKCLKMRNEERKSYETDRIQ